MLNKLWQAAYSGDVQKLQVLLADPAFKDKINYPMKSQNNQTALSLACNGAANPETIRLLLNAGADPFLRDDIGHLPLHFAAKSQDPELIAAIFQAPNMNNYILDSATYNGETPLQSLFLSGSGIETKGQSKIADLTRCLPFFLKKDQEPLKALQRKDNNGLSPLMLVKYYKLNAAFYPYLPVPAKIFDTLVKNISLPGNMEELLKSYIRTPFSESAFDNNEIFNVNENAKERRSFTDLVYELKITSGILLCQNPMYS